MTTLLLLTSKEVPHAQHILNHQLPRVHPLVSSLALIITLLLYSAPTLT